MQEESSNSVRQMVERMPKWLRVDLSSADPMLRQRAEDALFAMIAAATDVDDTAKAPSLSVDQESTAHTSM